MFTIFSTSKDHGGGPEATCGCVLVDGGQIIVINRSPKYNFDKLQVIDDVIRLSGVMKCAVADGQESRAWLQA